MNVPFRRLLVAGILTLLCTQVLYGALMLSALSKQYREPVLQTNGMVCQDIANHLSLLVRVGKSLRPQTLERALDSYRSRTEAEDLIVSDASGKVLFQWGQAEHPTPPSKLSPVFGPVQSFHQGKLTWITSPVLDRQEHVTGHVLLALDEDSIFAPVSRAAHSQKMLFIGVTLGECLLLVFLLRRYAGSSDVAGIPKKRLRLCFMLPLLLGQGVFLALLYHPLTDLYQKEAKDVGSLVGRQMAWDLERLAGMGLAVHDIPSMESWLMQRQQHVPSRAMAVFDAEGTLHTAASPEKVLTPEEWEHLAQENTTTVDILHPLTGATEGQVCVALDEDNITANLRSVLLDDLTMTVVAALFLSELVFLLILGSRGRSAMASSANFMRPIIFGCLFATEMACSYVAIRIGELGLDLFGLPPDVVSGLPVSCELFMAGIAMFLGGFWSQRSGWRPMLLSGILLACAGSLLSGMASTPLPFILSRGLAGLGYGFINLAAQIFVIAHTSEDRRAHDLAFMFAGLYAGTLCGSTMGGLVADRLGYAAVFPASAAMLLLTAVILWRLLPRDPWTVEQDAPTQKLSLKEALAFLSDRRMGALFLFFIVPNALITVCLFQFFVPLSLSQSGTSPATIGRVFMLYCLIVMFAGPLFGSAIDHAKRMERPLFLSMALASAGVAALLLLDGLPASLCCVSLLALSMSIAANGQGAYALSLPAARRFGKARTMGFYNVAMRIGQVLGPLSLGIMISIWNVHTGLTILTIATSISAVLFLVLCQAPSKDH